MYLAVICLQELPVWVCNVSIFFKAHWRSIILLGSAPSMVFSIVLEAAVTLNIHCYRGLKMICPKIQFVWVYMYAWSKRATWHKYMPYDVVVWDSQTQYHCCKYLMCVLAGFSSCALCACSSWSLMDFLTTKMTSVMLLSELHCLLYTSQC